MELISSIDIKGTHRLVRIRYPTVGILDAISTPEDLKYIQTLEGLTNDRLAAELGNIFFIPQEEWLLGKLMATVIMAAYCHPKISGSRFSNNLLGAWYAAFSLDAAFSEVIHHVKQELQEVGQFTSIHFREYLADFKYDYIDARADNWSELDIYDKIFYGASQKFAQPHRDAGAVSYSITV